MSGHPETRLMLLGWDFRAAEMSVRERIALTADEVREGLRRLSGRGLVSEGVIVSTCHRSEIYGLAEAREVEEELTHFISEWRGLERTALSRSSFRREGAEAARHLFRVAAGLDSMAIGESEVLGQVRHALRLARECGTTRSVLHRLFERAVATGKRVRAETEIAVHPLSIPAIGFELATKVFGELSGAKVVLLGAGETASLFARHAVESGVKDLIISNRTAGRAAALAARFGGQVVAWETWRSELASADLVVGTTASPEPLVTRPQVETAMRQRRGRPLFFLDLAVPRDIGSDVSEVYNVFAYSLQDLEEVAAENRGRRAREIPAAEAIVEEELTRFVSWLSSLSVAPTLSDLRRRFDQFRDEELGRVAVGERDRLRNFADSLASKFLREPIRRLKGEVDASKKLERVEAIRHLFDLD